MPHTDVLVTELPSACRQLCVAAAVVVVHSKDNEAHQDMANISKLAVESNPSLCPPQDRLCSGDAFSPAPVVGMRFGGRRDFTFGLCESLEC